MVKVLSGYIAVIFFVFCTEHSNAQQFVGLNTRHFAAVNHMITNPAWVNNSENGLEVMLFSVNAMAGNNAYMFRKKFVFTGFGGKARESVDYFRDPGTQDKYMWANVDICGPAASYKYKDHHIGMYTRMRQIYRAGGVGHDAFMIMGRDMPDSLYGQTFSFRNAGYSTHTFSEVGVTYGKILRDDYYHILKAGVTVKYLMGFVAGSVYTHSLDYTRKDEDTISAITGDFNALYTHNIGSYIDANAQNDISSWFKRAGRGGLGLDIGVQYEYHPNGNPNTATPYVFSVDASITDLGGVGYIADTGSGRYDLAIKNIDTYWVWKLPYEGMNDYMMRAEGDTLLPKGEKAEKFRMGLPTAFRLNADYNVSERFNMAVSVLLNMRGNGGDKYRSGYVSYLNFTPNFGGKFFRFAVPFTLMGYQTLGVGANLRIGPLYIGSTSALSMLMSTRLKNIDAYAGIVWKFKKKETDWGYHP